MLTNKIKRAFVLGLTAVVLFAGIPAPKAQAATNAPVRTSLKVSGKTNNQKVTYKLDLDKTKVTDGRVAVVYDPEVLTLTSGTTSIRFTETDINQNYKDGTGLAYAFVNDSAKTVKGTLLDVTFTVKNGVENQDTVVKTEVLNISNDSKNVVSNVVLEDTVNVGRPRPSVPKKVKLTQTILGVAVTWTKDANADGYFVYRSTSANGKYQLIGSTNLTLFYDAALRNNKTYYYKVVAYQNGSERKCSEPSEPVSIKVKKFFGIFS